MPYMTDDEIEALQKTKLSRDTPFAIYNVSQTQFSIARYYGAIKYNDKRYIYHDEFDELVREDVDQWLTKRRNKRQRRTDGK